MKYIVWIVLSLFSVSGFSAPEWVRWTEQRFSFEFSRDAEHQTNCQEVEDFVKDAVDVLGGVNPEIQCSDIAPMPMRWDVRFIGPVRTYPGDPYGRPGVWSQLTLSWGIECERTAVLSDAFWPVARHFHMGQVTAFSSCQDSAGYFLFHGDVLQAR